MTSLREKQVQALHRMLTLGSSGHGGRDQGEDFSEQWKILIYDQDCRDIISPLLNVGNLRSKGVTLHLLLDSDREPVPDAPAVYFVRPTEESIRRISEDCSNQLYRTVYLHFVTRIERPLLEKLAQNLVNSNSVNMITKIYDQYLDVVTLEPNLFQLNIRDSFYGYNIPGMGEQQIKSYMARVSTGLLSMVRVMGAIPVIRAPSGGAAEMLAHELCGSIKESITPRGPAYPLFSDALSSSISYPASGNVSGRPLLLIFDRTADMIPPLMHSATYQALVDDLLGLKLNKVTVTPSMGKAGSGAPKGTKKSYDLNTQSDTFFAQYAGSPFPEAVEANESKLAEVSQREQEIRSKPMAAAAAVDINNTKDLSAAIESLPEILARKANLEAHTTILQAAMNEIAARDIPTFFELELAMTTNGSVDRPAVLEVLRDGTKGTVHDKARLLALTAMVLSGDSTANYEEFESAFSAGCSAILTAKAAGVGEGAAAAAAPSDPAHEALVARCVKAVGFIRRLQSLQVPLSRRLAGSAGSTGGLSSLLTTAQSRASSLVAKATSFFAKFVPMHVTRVAEALAEGRSCHENDSYCTLDPRRLGPPSVGPGSSDQQPRYSEVIVFVIGGGCYSEYFNLMELVKQNLQNSGGLKRIYYGSTELMSGPAFLSQLERSGSA